jgi:DNA ligase-associated metallophosphoesterase
MTKYTEVSLLGQHLILLPDRTLFWAEEQLLVVADPHFGKAQVFRENGIPIPGGATGDDLERLSRQMERHKARKLLFLGDLIHGRVENKTNLNYLVDKWRRRHKNVELFLATGNHDLRSGDPPHQFQFDHVATEIIIGSFVFKHKPTFDGLFYGFAGHLHPAVTITGRGGMKETLSCFCFGSQGALLPAFGSFTGNQVIRPASEDRIYVVAGDEVVEI